MGCLWNNKNRIELVWKPIKVAIKKKGSSPYQTTIDYGCKSSSWSDLWHDEINSKKSNR